MALNKLFKSIIADKPESERTLALVTIAEAMNSCGISPSLAARNIYRLADDRTFIWILQNIFRVERAEILEILQEIIGQDSAKILGIMESVNWSENVKSVMKEEIALIYQEQAESEDNPRE